MNADEPVVRFVLDVVDPLKESSRVPVCIPVLQLQDSDTSNHEQMGPATIGGSTERPGLGLAQDIDHAWDIHVFEDCFKRCELAVTLVSEGAAICALDRVFKNDVSPDVGSVFHFVGSSDPGVLYFEKPDLCAEPVSAQQLRATLGTGCPPLVFLSTVSSSKVVGEELAAAGVRHVVAMTGEIAASATAVFVTEFYTALVKGVSVQDAFDAASRAFQHRHELRGMFQLFPAGRVHEVRRSRCSSDVNADSCSLFGADILPLLPLLLRLPLIGLLIDLIDVLDRIMLIITQEVLFAGLPKGLFENLTPESGGISYDFSRTIMRNALLKRVCDGVAMCEPEAARCVSVHGAARSGKTTLAISAAKYLFARGRVGGGVLLVEVTGCESEEEFARASLRELKRSPMGGLSAAALAALASVPEARGAATGHMGALVSVLEQAKCLLILDDIDSMNGDAHERAAVSFAKILGTKCRHVRLILTTRCADSATWAFAVAITMPESFSLEEVAKVFWRVASKCANRVPRFGQDYFANDVESFVAAFVRHFRGSQGCAEFLALAPDVIAKLVELLAAEEDAVKMREFIDDAPRVRARFITEAQRQVAAVRAESDAARDGAMIRRRPLPSQVTAATAWYTRTTADDLLRDAFWPAPSVFAEIPRRRYTFTPRIVAVSGMSGVGKTQLAMRYAFDADMKGVYPGGVYWLGGPTLDEDVKYCVVNTAGLECHRDEMHADVLRDAFHCWLGTAPPWLLVVDNVDSLHSLSSAKGVFPDLAPCGRGHILITARLGQHWLREQVPGVHVLEANTMGTHDAATLLLRRACARASVDTAGLQEAASELLAVTGDRPFARDLLSRLRGTAVDDEWITCEAAAVQLLVRAAGLDGLPLALEIAGADVGSHRSDGFARFARDFVGQPAPLLIPAPSLDSQLRLFGLACFTEVLVVEVGLTSLDDVAAFGSNDTPFQTRALREAGFDDLQLRRLRAAAASAAADPERVAHERQSESTLARMFLIAQGRGEISEAAHEALLVREARLSRGVSRELIDMSYVSEEALAREQWVLKVRRAALPAGHVDIASSMHNIAAYLNELGRYEEALACAQEALTIRRAALRPGHLDIARALRNVACCMGHLGRPKDALRLAQEALAIGRTALPVVTQKSQRTWAISQAI